MWDRWSPRHMFLSESCYSAIRVVSIACYPKLVSFVVKVSWSVPKRKNHIKSGLAPYSGGYKWCGKGSFSGDASATSGAGGYGDRAKSWREQGEGWEGTRGREGNCVREYGLWAAGRSSEVLIISDVNQISLMLTLLLLNVRFVIHVFAWRFVCSAERARCWFGYASSFSMFSTWSLWYVSALSSVNVK